MMLPYMIRASDLALRLVPGTLREASAALGAPTWRGELQVVIPTARSGLATAVILGIARGIGEASPVLLTAGYTTYINANPLHGPMASLPLAALKLVQTGNPAYTARAFACASFLLLLVIVLFVTARKIGGWGPGHLTERGMRRVRQASARDAARYARRAAVSVAPIASDHPTRRTPDDRHHPPPPRRHCRHAPPWSLVAVLSTLLGAASPAGATSYVPVNGEGSSWSAGALDQWIADVHADGMQINYTANGSTTGRQDFINGQTDFAASDIPFQTDPGDGSAPEHPQAGSYAYMPITAGGTVFMYNLKINGQRVTNLRLSGENITKIFTGAITNWDDPALAADNPGLQPAEPDHRPGRASRRRRAPATSCRPGCRPVPESVEHLLLQGGPGAGVRCDLVLPDDDGHDRPERRPGGGLLRVPGLRPGSIGYVNYYYALAAKFPVAQVLNSAGYYTEPTPQNVAVSLLQDKVDTTDVNDPALYLTQQLTGVYTDPDPRTYPLSSYGYLILPTKVGNSFTDGQGGDPGRLLRTTPCARANSSRPHSATHPCPSTWCRRPSPRSPRSPAPTSRASTSSPATTRPSARPG